MSPGTVDVVYTLAPKSKHGDDWELRYSLRSLAAQDWIRDVYFVGHCPEWVKDGWCVEATDPFGAKDANIINKVLLACQVPELSETFVVNSDDHYILKPIPFEGLGPWLENPSQLPDSYKNLGSSWHRRLVSSISWCRQHKLPPWVFECHIPYPVEKARYVDAWAEVPGWQMGNGFVTHMYYKQGLAKGPTCPQEGKPDVDDAAQAPDQHTGRVVALGQGADVLQPQRHWADAGS